MCSESSPVASNRTDSTPLLTRILLLVVLCITATAFGLILYGSINPRRPGEIEVFLWLCTALFILRVGGQILVALRPRRWLPPMEQWNLIPYPILLPIQLVLIVIMIWINTAFSQSFWVSIAKNQGIDNFLIVFSAVYANVMILRYAVRMGRRPDQRWFGGTIPIVFHFVLAFYLYLLGNFYAHA
jgi:hypothetical protein